MITGLTAFFFKKKDKVKCLKCSDTFAIKTLLTKIVHQFRHIIWAPKLVYGRENPLDTLLIYNTYIFTEGAKNVSSPWPFPLRGWSSLTMAFIDKFVCI